MAHTPTEKRAKGRYFTKENPFTLKPFQKWARDADLSSRAVLEPFAGANNLIHMLKREGLARRFASYDIRPASLNVLRRDTIRDFPQGFDVCITNPPWLARNSATRRGLPFPSEQYDDLYKHCLKLCLDSCAYVAAIAPASFLQSGLFQDRLQTYILLHGAVFSDTENPVCLSLFGKPRFFDGADKDIEIYYDERFVGRLSDLEKHCPQPKRARTVRFNDPDGGLGFISFDNTREPSIRFCDVREIADYEIKVSSRFITRIGGHFGDVSEIVARLNGAIGRFRAETHDVFLTPFKGIREDGRYRRRMDFALARKFINAA